VTHAWFDSRVAHHLFQLMKKLAGGAPPLVPFALSGFWYLHIAATHCLCQNEPNPSGNSY